MRLVLFACLLAVVGGAQEAVWRDPSQHRVQFVAVEDGVHLEVLDWGGSGRPIVLLAGYNTAHVFDDFAAKLAETNRVYGITRRGFGSSSHPDSGYATRRSAEDVLKVLDALNLAAPVLVGHSFGGQDLTVIGAWHPQRVAALIYLNSAEDATLGERIWPAIGIDPSDVEAARKNLPATMDSPTTKPGRASFQDYRDWQMKTRGFAFPESELRQLFAANADGTMGSFAPAKRVRDAIFAGVEKPDYAKIRAPVLALFASPLPFDDQVRKYEPQNDNERRAMEQHYTVNVAIVRKHIADLRSGVPTARVIELPGANHFLFLSNEADVLRELRSFLAGLP